MTFPAGLLWDILKLILSPTKKDLPSDLYGFIPWPLRGKLRQIGCEEYVSVIDKIEAEGQNAILPQAISDPSYGSRQLGFIWSLCEASSTY